MGKKGKNKNTAAPVVTSPVKVEEKIKVEVVKEEKPAVVVAAAPVAPVVIEKVPKEVNVQKEIQIKEEIKVKAEVLPIQNENDEKDDVSDEPSKSKRKRNKKKKSKIWFFLFVCN